MPTPKVANRNPNPYGEDGRPKGKLWSVIMGRRMGASKEGGASQEPLDAKGNPIRYVDANGKAISEVKYLESVKTDNPAYNRFGNPGVSTKGYVPAYFNASGPATPEAFVITSNIDPKEISAIRLFANQQTRVKFGGLPSDPRS
ncbi:hypothetical protein EON79_02310 [bacterium]|nr:MAG: hypothetical protein EON79_02310 [bacterium]